MAPFSLACLWVPGLEAGSGPSEPPNVSRAEELGPH